MSEVKPSRAHAKASIACMILILCGLGFSAVFPFISIQCVRDGDRIESVIEKRILGLIPFNTTRIEHLAGVSLLLETGVNQRIRTVDTYYFQFDDSQGNETKVMARPYKGFAEPLRAVVAEINAFLDDDDAHSIWIGGEVGIGAHAAHSF